MEHVTHWTERSTEDFFYSIASDFIEQLQEKMEAVGMKQSQLAIAARISKSYVSKVFKNPGNLSLETMVRFARTVGMKVSIVAYEDKNDLDNTRGPINSEIFRLCWENSERPADMWTIKEKVAAKTDALAVNALFANMEWGKFVYTQTSNSARSNLSNGFARVAYKLPVKKAMQSEWDANQVIKYVEV